MSIISRIKTKITEYMQNSTLFNLSDDYDKKTISFKLKFKMVEEWHDFPKGATIRGILKEGIYEFHYRNKIVGLTPGQFKELIDSGKIA